MVIDLETAALRLALAIAFGALIGIERQWRHKNAGIKTNTLVCLGAAGFSIVSNTFGAENHNPAQIAAAVVTGIGFIGAGVIIHRGATVQGVTTAATLWVTAAMGVTIGIGQLPVAFVLFASIVVVQFTMRRIGVWVARASRSNVASRVEILVECDPSSLRSLNATWKEFVDSQKLTAMRRSSTRGRHSWTWRASVVVEKQQPLDLGPLEETLVAIEGVTHVEAKFLGWEDEPSGGM